MLNKGPALALAVETTSDPADEDGHVGGGGGAHGGGGDKRSLAQAQDHRRLLG